MSLRSANSASLPVLTQDSQGPQTVAPDHALTAAQILCIGQVITERLNPPGRQVEALTAAPAAA